MSMELSLKIILQYCMPNQARFTGSYSMENTINSRSQSELFFLSLKKFTFDQFFASAFMIANILLL